MPLRTVFGWQRPCYLLGEGYVPTFKQLMDETNWDAYGVGNYEKCADCMVHCGFEATRREGHCDAPVEGALKVALFGVSTEGPMAPDISLENQRPAEYVFDANVATLSEIREHEAKQRAEQAVHSGLTTRRPRGRRDPRGSDRRV